MITRAQLKSKVYKVDLPEYNDFVCLRSPLVKEQLALLAKNLPIEDYNLQLLALCICDEEGKLLFDETNIGELPLSCIVKLSQEMANILSIEKKDSIQPK